MAGRAPDTIEPANAWAARALCRDEDPETFEDGRNIAAARAICARCPVTRQCLEDILRIEGNAGVRSRSGIYAGTTPADRRRRYETSRRAA